MQKVNFILKVLSGFVILFAIFTSCVPIKKQIYLQTKEDTTKTKFFSEQYLDFKLQPGNNLYVQVYSIDEELSQFFNLGGGTTSGGNIYYDAAIYLNSYLVNDSGFVELPFIGKLYVKGLTIEEAKEIIQDQIDKYVREIIVIVKLVNYNVTIVGEIERPGQYKIYQDRINIFEVISLAGDMTTFAKRDDIILVRKTEKGSKMYHIDLLRDNILESEFYYIMPDDIIYIKPVKGKNYAFESFPYTLVISSISLTLALIAIFK